MLRVKNQIKMIRQTRIIIEKEIAEKSSRARSEFLSRMSHEMRTPMNAVMGLSVLAKNAAEPARNAMLDKINGESGRLLDLIDEVLCMSDIEDGKFKLTVSEFNFPAIIQSASDKANPEIERKKYFLQPLWIRRYRTRLSVTGKGLRRYLIICCRKR